MRVSLKWLNDYVDLSGLTKEEIYEAISLHVSEIETMKELSTATNLVVGEVLTCEMHPNSDHLHVCKVNVGSIVLDIVCGAPNVAVGEKVIVALEGAKLPGGTIKLSKVRGVESHGMLCSLQELGIEERLIDEKYKNGIYLLPSDAVVGSDVIKYLNLDDVIIDLELTSNRSDLLSIEGVAYDVAATLNRDLALPIFPIKETKMINPLSVKIESDACYEYQARLINNVEIKESPMWLKMRLIASGIRPINNVVDITNYVMITLGQPMHAYDYDFVGNNIVIKDAGDLKEFVTLDNIKRELDPTDVMITDGNKALGLAGIMGGLNSEVLPETKNVVLEVAMFEPLRIRKTSSRLNLKSEASTRFERIVCQERIERAINMASSLICSLAGGTICGGIVKDVKKPYEVKYVDVTLNKINSFLGTNITKDELEDIFNRLRYEYIINDQIYHITIPARRMDLEAFFADICEDVARMIGYDKIPTTISTINEVGHLTVKQQQIRNIKEVLAHIGLNEIVTYSLVSEQELNLYNIVDIADPIKVLMPLTNDRAYMRLSVLNGIISTISYNLARQINDVAVFETGKRYSLTKEETMLAGGICGSFSSSLWQQTNQKVDFFLLKGILDLLASKLNLAFEYEAYTDIKSTYHLGLAAKIYVEKELVGFIAGLHPKFRKEHDLKESYVFELNLDKVLAHTAPISYKPISKFPSIERDLAIVVDSNVKAKEVIDVIKMVAKKYLVSIDIFDLYEDISLGENKKSLAIKMLFNDSNKTLETNDINKVINSILNRLDFYFKATLR